MNPKLYLKAIWAALSSLIASLGLVASDGITLTEGLGVAGAVVAITGGVFGFTNDEAPASLDKPGKVVP